MDNENQHNTTLVSETNRVFRTTNIIRLWVCFVGPDAHHAPQFESMLAVLSMSMHNACGTDDGGVGANRLAQNAKTSNYVDGKTIRANHTPWDLKLCSTATVEVCPGKSTAF